MDRLISLQAAIDALADYIHNLDKAIGMGHLSADDCKDAATSVLEDLPSAQPYTDKEVQKIQDLEQSQFDKMYELGYQAGRSAQPEYIMNEWCTDCKEYDHEKHCCPRFNRVIRQTLSEQTEIIYCKDCKHRPDKAWFGCPMVSSSKWQLDGFCSYAERRTDEADR